MQVSQGFSRVSMHLQNQDEMITSQKGNTTAGGQLMNDFDAKVQEAVDKRIGEINAKYAREIADLKEGQQEMLRLLKSSIANAEDKE